MLMRGVRGLPNRGQIRTENRILTAVSSRGKLLMVAVLAAYVLVQVLRGPDVLLHGRFFAEEGAFWWNHARSTTWIEQIGFVAPIAGYVTMNANLQVLVASWLPIEYGPLWTAWTSLLIMALPGVAAWHYRPQWLRKRWAALLALGLLFGPPVAVPEVFANSINSQVFLGLTACVIVVFGPGVRGRADSIGLAVVLAIAALSGWYSAALAPLFVLRAARNARVRQDIVNACVVSAALVIQVFALAIAKSQGAVWPHRFAAETFVPRLGSYAFDSATFLLLGEQSRILSAVVGGTMLLALFTFILHLNRAKKSVPQANKLTRNRVGMPRLDASFALLLALAAWAMELTLVVVGQAEPYFGGRYATVPSGALLVVLVILMNLLEPAPSAARFLVPLVVVTACTWIAHFTTIDDSLLECRTPCVPWAMQIEEFRHGDRRILGHWPMNSDPGDWRSDPNHPVVTLAPFQAAVMSASETAE